MVMTGMVWLRSASAAPTVQEQANYDASCQAVVTAVNSFRSANGKTALEPLRELCQAAREDSEFLVLGVGTSDSIFIRATNAGYTGTYLTGSTAFGSRGQLAAAALFQNLINGNAANQATFLSDDAASIGVGMAFKAQGPTSEWQLRIVLGKKVGGNLGGTIGIESGTGRGLLLVSLLEEIRDRAWSGNSINGYVVDPNVISLTPSEERAVAAAIAAFVRGRATVRTEVGQSVNVKIPAQLFVLIEKLTVTGKLPPGVRYDRRRGIFRGTIRAPGTYLIRLSGSLRGEVNNSEKLKPIRIRFLVED